MKNPSVLKEVANEKKDKFTIEDKKIKNENEDEDEDECKSFDARSQMMIMIKSGSLESDSKTIRSLKRMLNKFWRRHRGNAVITDIDPSYKVAYLGNVLTGWAKGEGCVEKPVSTLWRNYVSSNRPDVSMKLTVTNNGLIATTKDHGLTEYWAHRVTYGTAPQSHPRLFVWVYRHEGRKLRPELRCHAALCSKESTAKRLAKVLNTKLYQALLEFRRDKVSRQNARLSLANSVYENPSLPHRKILLSTGGINYRPPLERSKSAPKLSAIEEDTTAEENEQEQFNGILSKIRHSEQNHFPFSRFLLHHQEVLLKNFSDSSDYKSINTVKSEKCIYESIQQVSNTSNAVEKNFQTHKDNEKQLLEYSRKMLDGSSPLTVSLKNLEYDDHFIEKNDQKNLLTSVDNEKNIQESSGINPKTEEEVLKLAKWPISETIKKLANASLTSTNNLNKSLDTLKQDINIEFNLLQRKKLLSQEGIIV